jgi:hypothetical protein
VTGWWEERAAVWERKLPYSVIASVDLGEVDLDLYLLAAVTLQPVPVDVEVQA